MEYLSLETLSVAELMEYFDKGLIAVPEIQRDVVWSSDQVKDLFDSIYKNYPCGSLILWEPRLRDEKLLREIIRPERLKFYDKRLPKYLLIDGQQRITALASALLRKSFLRELEPEIEEDLVPLFVDLTHFPDEIEAATDPEAYKFPWILMNNVFDGSFRGKSAYKKFNSEQKNKIEHYIQRIRDYKFPVQIIKERDYPTVGKIFARVNSQGTQLTGAEIHVATIIPYWPGITKEFRSYRKDLHNKGYDLDLTFLMRAITAIECKVPKIEKLADKVARRGVTRNQLNQRWRESKRAIDTVIQVLRKDLSLDKTKFFPSKNALIPLVYYAAIARGKNLFRKGMMKYFLVSQLGRHYSGAGESVLRRDLRYFADAKPSQALRELLDFATDEAKRDYRGLKIAARQISGLPSKNVMLLLMYIIMRQRKATDFGLSNPWPLHEIAGSELQIHHIFPFDFMTTDKKAKLYQDKRELSSQEFRDQINDIANMTFLTQKTNVQIGNVSPAQYLVNDTTIEIRKAHFIPEDKQLWNPENFDKFLDRRRKLLAGSMNSLLRSLH
jgi:hypothetical protein